MGGRGASSSAGKTWNVIKNKRYSGILERLGINEQQYLQNRSASNMLYMGIINTISDAYEKATGQYGDVNQDQFDKFIKNYDIKGNLTEIEKEYVRELKKKRR